MRDLIILGTSCHAIEIADMVDRINAVEPTWRLLGHVAPQAGGSSECAKRPVLGTDTVLADHADAMLVSDNEYKDISDIPDDRLASLVDPTSVVTTTAAVGPGSVIYPHVFVGHDARIRRRVLILAGCVVNHDVVLEDNVILCSGVSLAGAVHVEAGCYLGQQCTVRQYLRIGRNSLIGMGSVVVKNVEPDSVMAGNPAQRLRSR